jgi:hypothetical protein
MADAIRLVAADADKQKQTSVEDLASISYDPFTRKPTSITRARTKLDGEA